jgi:hypothetical protein
MVVAISPGSFVGTYKMISSRRRLVATGEVVDAYGPNPLGYIMYGIEGRMLAMVVHDMLRAPVADLPTSTEKAKLYDTMVAYGGTYIFHGDRVEHHIDMAYNETWVGTTNVRYISWEAGKMIYRTLPAPFSADGALSSFEIVWQKLPGLSELSPS